MVSILTVSAMRSVSTSPECVRRDDSTSRTSQSPKISASPQCLRQSHGALDHRESVSAQPLSPDYLSRRTTEHQHGKPRLSLTQDHLPSRGMGYRRSQTLKASLPHHYRLSTATFTSDSILLRNTCLFGTRLGGVDQRVCSHLLCLLSRRRGMDHLARHERRRKTLATMEHLRSARPEMAALLRIACLSVLS